VDPKSPLRADHRFLHQIISTQMGGKVEELTDSECIRVSAAFRTAGGSWERVFKGSPDDILLLKQVLQIALKDGVLRKVDG
jgi:hypothetical protein